MVRWCGHKNGGRFELYMIPFLFDANIRYHRNRDSVGFLHFDVSRPACQRQICCLWQVCFPKAAIESSSFTRVTHHHA